MVLSYMSRLLQTAHSNELYIGPQKTRYHVWIFFKPEDLPANERRSERMRPRRKRSRLSFPSALSKSSDDEDEEEERSSQRKNRKNNAKVLTKIRSRISSVKSKSLPAVRPGFLSGNSRSKKQRSARRLEEIDENEEGKPEEETRLLSEYATRSESVLKKDRLSVFSLLSNSSSVNLPPPPPPFVLTLENEEPLPEVVPSRSSGTKTKFSQPLSESIVTSQNSGRRVKVLEKFGEIRERCDKSTQHRESGGADIPNGNLSRSIRSRDDIRARLSSTDVYDRFRGTLQHTLARREAVRARKDAARVYNPGNQKKLDIRRSNVLARIKCNNVPPSYRLLADFELHKQSVLQTHPMQRVPSISFFLPPPAPPLPPPPPPPPLPFSPPNAVKRSRNSARICGTKVLPREQRQCSICNRPVVQSPSCSRESLVEACKDARTFSSSARRKARATFSRHREFLRGDYVPWNRSTLVSKSVQRG